MQEIEYITSNCNRYVIIGNRTPTIRLDAPQLNGEQKEPTSLYELI